MDEVIIGGGELGGWLWRYGWHFTEVDALRQDTTLGVGEKALTFLSLGRYPETGNILDVLLISYPLSKVAALPAHYNLKVFILLLGNGLMGYALGRSLTWSRSAALVGGLLAILNPLTLQDLTGSGLRQVLLWWVLLFPIALDRAERTTKPGAGLLAGVVLGLCGAWYWFYGLFAGMAFGVYLLDLLWRHRGRMVQLRRHLPWLGALLAGAILVGGVFFLPYALGEGGGESGGAQKLPELSFFLKFPSYDTIADVPLRPATYEENVLSSLNRTISSSWSIDHLVNPTHPRGWPLVLFFGGVLPALVLKPGLFPRSRYWVAVFLVFFVGTLGPFLKVGGDTDQTQVLVLGGEWVVRLPWTGMFRWVPGMSRMFAPYRMASLAVVAAVALVSMGLSRINNRLLRLGVAGLAISLSFAQLLYRWEIGPVESGAIAPTMWRAPIKVSKLFVPEWYQALPAAEQEGIIEMPLEQQQDLLYYYQLNHGRKVYDSWATMPAVPPQFRSEGGGQAGDWMRYTARRDVEGQIASDLMDLSRKPEVFDARALDLAELQKLAVVGNYRHLVVHERGYYLVDPYSGALNFRETVQELEDLLGQDAQEMVEIQWMDYPGNRYTVPDGPVYVPWSSQEVSLSDKQMPNRYFMAVFDLGPLVDSWEGPPPETLIQDKGPGAGGPVHREMPPGAP